MPSNLDQNMHQQPVSLDDFYQISWQTQKRNAWQTCAGFLTAALLWCLGDSVDQSLPTSRTSDTRLLWINPTLDEWLKSAVLRSLYTKICLLHLKGNFYSYTFYGLDLIKTRLIGNEYILFLLTSHYVLTAIIKFILKIPQFMNI